MYTVVQIKAYKPTDKGTELRIFVPKENLGEFILDKNIRTAEVRFDDGRTISAEQRRKAYALIDAVAEWSGLPREETKSWAKMKYYAKTGEEHLSLKDCSVTDAREFIGILLDFCVEQGIQLDEPGVLYAEDIGRYLYMCLKCRKCCICGRDHADLHHVDAIGSGRNRNKIDDSNMRKMSLCRTHHQVYHQIGRERFEAMYHVYGIVAKDIEVTEEDEKGFETTE